MRIDEFHGVNAAYVLELYDRFRQDPLSVDPATRRAFETWSPPTPGPAAASMPAAGAVDAGSPRSPGSDVSRHSATDIATIVGAANLADCIRRYGHLAARIDPLGSEPIGDPSLSPAAHGITDDDLRRLPASLVEGPVAESSASAFDAIEGLRRVYCSTTVFDYAHVFVPAERDWLRHAAESGRFLPPVDAASAAAVLDRLSQVEAFERFLHRTFPGKTRFSVEGLDMLVPILDEVIGDAGEAGISSILIGMAHRGRLNVMAHVLCKPYEQILAEFKDPISSRNFREDMAWTGDVKYHAGAQRAIKDGPEIAM